MRHGRAKAARKTLKFFSLNGNIKPPFRVLLDGNFLAAVVKNKVPLHERISKTLQHQKFSLHVCRSALEDLARTPGDISKQGRQLGLDECTIIEKESIPKSTTYIENESKNASLNHLSSSARDIFMLVLKDGKHNPDGYIIATQDKHMSDILRQTPNVPQMHLSRGVLIFDSPSAASKKVFMREERDKQKTGGGTLTEHETNMIRQLKEMERRKRKASQMSDVNKFERNIKKAKAPNPLSCKKKTENNKSTQKKKRRRRNSTKSIL
mmetsp:Transcript_19450/g.27366  ORF Transcript_19450/g.27366 Transcript_19450/m.27366 type:complete len:266 (+) Transcript_19450:46-843(+)